MPSKSFAQEKMHFRCNMRHLINNSARLNNFLLKQILHQKRFATLKKVATTAPKATLGQFITWKSKVGT